MDMFDTLITCAIFGAFFWMVAQAQIRRWLPEEDASAVPTQADAPAAQSSVLIRAGDLLLRYRDVNGRISERRISPQEVLENPKSNKTPSFEKINAFCHKQKSRRTFVIIRITDAVDAQTGEILSPLALQAWLRERVHK